jgi:hypothetical protein
MSKGGGSSIPANTSSTVTNQVQLPGWVNTLAQQNVTQAQNLAGQPYNPYPGTTVAPLNATQQAGLNAAAGVLGSTEPVFNQAINNTQNLPQTTQSLLNPYLSDVENAAVSNIQRQGGIAGTALASGAVGQGAFGGTRYGIEQALNNSETQRNIGQTVAGIESQGWNTATTTALQQAQQEAALATAGQNASLQGAQAAIGAGGAVQTQDQAQIQAAIQKWQAAQNWPYQQLAISQGALAGTPYGTQTSSTQPYAQNQTANALGNVGAGIGLLNAGSNLGLFSGSNLLGGSGPVFGTGGLFGSMGPLFGPSSLAAMGSAGAGLGALAAGGAGAAGALDASSAAALAAMAGGTGAEVPAALALFAAA